MRSKFMPFGRTGLPPGRPVGSQAAVARLGALVGREECDLHLLPRQHIRDQRRHFHMAGVQREVHGLVARVRRGRARQKRDPCQRRRN
jgi:hypothetical protein